MTGLVGVEGVWASTIGERLVDWDESVTWVDEVCVDDAVGAVIPVRAVETLVTYTIDEFVASIADSLVTGIAAWLEKSLGERIKLSILDSCSEGMLWVVAVGKASMACNAKVKVITSCAGDKVVFWEF